jgi:hypothetical protein
MSKTRAARATAASRSSRGIRAQATAPRFIHMQRTTHGRACGALNDQGAMRDERVPEEEEQIDRINPVNSLLFS